MKDELPKKISNNGSYVINTDEGFKLGTHWQAILSLKRFPHCYFFDSFGKPPNNVFADFMRTGSKAIMYNDSELQMSTSITCGYFCIYIIKGCEVENYYDVLYELDQRPSRVNEDKIEKIL